MKELVAAISIAGQGGRTHGVCIMGLIMVLMNVLGIAEFPDEVIQATMLTAGLTIREAIESSSKRLRSVP